jgi:hypothetical protein
MVEQNMRGTLLNATAIFDDVSEKVYATVNSREVPFSKDDDLVIITNGISALVKVLELERIGEVAIASFDYPMEWLMSDINWSFGSELAVAIKTLPKSKQMEMVKPYATIDVSTANVDNEEILLEFKQKMESVVGLTFFEALASLDTSSQAKVTFNTGNPKTMMDTFVADKVKANFSKKGLVLVPGKTKGQFISNSVQEQFADVLREIREKILTRDEKSSFTEYRLSAIDKDSRVIINSQKIKDVRVVKKDGNKEFRIKFNENHDYPDIFVGECTIVIDKKNVENSDSVQWYGVDEIAHGLTFFADDDQGHSVCYNKKYSDDFHGVHLEFSDYNRYDLLNNGNPSVVTVDLINIFGTIKMDKDNKVVFVSPSNNNLLWTKKMASIKSHGYANVRSIEVGSSASVETLQLKVELESFNKALEISKNIRSLGNTVTLAELIIQFGQLKVTNAILSLAKPSVKVTNAAVTLDPSVIIWFNDSFEIFFQDENHMMTLCDGFGTFQDLLAPEVLNAIVSDIKNMKEQTYRDLVELPISNNLDKQSWGLKTNGFGLTITDAEITKTAANGYKYQFHYNSSLVPVFVSKAPVTVLFTKKMVFLN